MASNKRCRVFQGNNIYANADYVSIPEIGLNCQYQDGDAVSIIELAPENGTDSADFDFEMSDMYTHSGIEFFYGKRHTTDGRVNVAMKGRFWRNRKILAFWKDTADMIYPSSEDMKYYADEIRNYQGRFMEKPADVSDYYLVKQLYGEDVNTVIMMPVMDYIRGNFTGNENRAAQFEPPMGVPDKIRRFPGDDEYTKLRNYRAWNGMEIDEEKNLLTSADIPPKLYHATPSCYLNSIMRYGLGAKLPTRRFWDYRGTPYENIKQGVFLATSPYVAEDFLDSSDEYWELKEEFEERTGQEISIAVLEVDTKFLDMSRLSIDENNSDDEDLTYFYNGVIPSSRIRIC